MAYRAEVYEQVFIAATKEEVWSMICDYEEDNVSGLLFADEIEVVEID